MHIDRDDPALGHLAHDALYCVCSGCGRRTWDRGSSGRRCLMPQPNGSLCVGFFGPLIDPRESGPLTEGDRVVIEFDRQRIRQVMAEHGIPTGASVDQILLRLESVTAERDHLRGTEQMLRAHRDELIRQCDQLARQLGEAQGRLEASEWPSVIEGWRAQRDQAVEQRENANAATARAEAERTKLLVREAHWAAEADRFEAERDRYRDDLLELVDGLRVLRADMADHDIDDPYRDEEARNEWVRRLDRLRAQAAPSNQIDHGGEA